MKISDYMTKQPESRRASVEFVVDDTGAGQIIDILTKCRSYVDRVRK